jgi:hypothetical protein
MMWLLPSIVANVHTDIPGLNTLNALVVKCVDCMTNALPRKKHQSIRRKWFILWHNPCSLVWRSVCLFFSNSAGHEDGSHYNVIGTTFKLEDTISLMSRDSAVGIATGYGLDD